MSFADLTMPLRTKKKLAAAWLADIKRKNNLEDYKDSGHDFSDVLPWMPCGIPYKSPWSFNGEDQVDGQSILDVLLDAIGRNNNGNYLRGIAVFR